MTGTTDTRYRSDSVISSECEPMKTTYFSLFMCVTFIIYHLWEAVLHSWSSWPVASITWVTRCCSWGSLEHLWHVLTLKHVGGSVANQIQGILHQFHSVPFVPMMGTTDTRCWVILLLVVLTRQCILVVSGDTGMPGRMFQLYPSFGYSVTEFQVSGLVTNRNMWLSILETWTWFFWDVMVVPKNPFSEMPQSWVSFDSYNIGLSIPMVVGWGIQREHKLFYQGTT